jgi:hypothetical protein
LDWDDVFEAVVVEADDEPDDRVRQLDDSVPDRRELFPDDDDDDDVEFPPN